MRRHGFLAIVVACAAATAAWLLNQHHPLVASEEPSGSFREAFRGRSDQPEPVEDETGVRLNYFDAGWERVLRDVAKQAELTLVMDKVPHGSFARRDRNRYHIDSVVRILNTELEAQGFRLLQQQQFLIVLKLDQARTRYARPVLNEWKNADSGSLPPVNGNDQRRDSSSEFRTASARKDDDTPRVAWASQENNRPAGDEAADGKPQSPFADRVVPQPRDAAGTGVNAAEEGPAVRKTISVRHGKASEIARSIYLVFESRSELVASGLMNLPTVVVQRSPEAAGDDAASPDDNTSPLFQIAIDQANNQLIIEASQVRVNHLEKLVGEIDKPADQKAGTVKLVLAKA
ncbi:MAG: secretin N-terminal domain-containing protein [Planctomycetaceae bacterium]